jgi:hypothetical protein
MVDALRIRQKAMDYTGHNLRPGQDGYGYLPCADYEREIEWICKAISEFAGSYSDIRFALEYKPKEPRARSYMARVADTIAGECRPFKSGSVRQARVAVVWLMSVPTLQRAHPQEI